MGGGGGATHPVPRRAGIGRVASVLALGGRVTGKLTKALRRALEYGPFRQFCAFNVELERSAELCWARLVDLAEGDAQREEFTQVCDDEVRHGRIFTILQDTLGDDDRLRPGVTPADLVAQVREVGEWFLPQRDRGAGATRRVFGTGSPVWCRQGQSAGDKRTVLRGDPHRGRPARADRRAPRRERWA